MRSVSQTFIAGIRCWLSFSMKRFHGYAFDPRLSPLVGACPVVLRRRGRAVLLPDGVAANPARPAAHPGTPRGAVRSRTNPADPEASGVRPGGRTAAAGGRGVQVVPAGRVPLAARG